MAVLPIEKKSDNPILRAISEPIKKIDKKLLKLLDDMRDTMFAAEGIGLAAPQIGKNIRVVICYFNNGTKNELIVDMINPLITQHSERLQLAEEGCLSLPGEYNKVRRHSSLTVKYLDRKGKSCTLQLSGLNARIVQHELDHIDGKLYIDRVEKTTVL